MMTKSQVTVVAMLCIVLTTLLIRSDSFCPPQLLVNPSTNSLRPQEENHSINAGAVVKNKVRRKVFMVINTAAAYGARREAIRNSWLKRLNKLSPEYEGKFFCGDVDDEEESKALHEEAEKYNDLIILKTADQYKHIGTKVQAQFKYVMDNYDIDFLAKADDDCWLNVDLFITLSVTKNVTYLGRMFYNSPVVRGDDQNAENNVPKWLKKFPAYASGFMIVLSLDLVKLYIAPPIPVLKTVSDDTLMGLLFLPYNVNMMDDKRIYPFGFMDCREIDNILAIHYMLPACMNAFERNLTTGLSHCDTRGCYNSQPEMRRKLGPGYVT
eukprot:m.101346 g.101346  ORF g.101346 m.101346 type:complete len:325 (-) comp27325_c0_seq1:36-1010(-)